MPVKKTRKKRKDREESKMERLEKEIRELKSINRSLTKQLKKLNKGANRIEDLELLLKDSSEKEDKQKNTLCSACGRGIINTILIAGREINSCNTCSYRTTNIVKKQSDT